MNVIRDLFHAMFFVGLPLMALSFALIFWALHRGRLEGETVSDLQKSIASLARRRKDRKKGKDQGDGGKGDLVDRKVESTLESTERKDRLDPVLEKWFSFGGGFYGLVALYTWILIEWGEIRDFFGGLFDIVVRIDPGAIIGLVIRLFIESLMNFVTAIAWPVYWLREAGNPLVWIVVAYGGYWLGIHFARRVAGRTWNQSPDELVDAITGADDEAP